MVNRERFAIFRYSVAYHFPTVGFQRFTFHKVIRISVVNHRFKKEIECVVCNFDFHCFGYCGPGCPRPDYLPNRHVLFVNPANEAMGVNVVQIFVGRKYRRVAGTNQLPIRVVDVVANIFNEIRCFRAVGGFNCCHNSFCF